MVQYSGWWCDIPPVILAKDLVKCYDDFVAVDRIDFEVREGELFGFLGPNGAGKTTTMRMVECVSPKTTGTLEVFSMDVNTRQREIKQLLGVVPQETNLDPDFSVYENLEMYARYFDIPREEASARAEELLEFVQLQDKRDARIDNLSGGMKRRLILARALMNNPRLLILDEPTVGLDPQARHLLWEKLRHLQAQGNTIVITTHYMEEAERLCDRLVIMDHGKILVDGNPTSLVREYVGTDIVEADAHQKTIECLQSLDARYEVWNNRVQVYTDRPQEITSALMEKCRIGGSISARPATLEDVFLKLTGRTLRE
ncbi:MAG TPA: ABC transporter ATP-binding protein [Methanomicrobiales archaeon]|nr:ABC transporter ATP-binding protein [Methanomicrobiales archaeon]